MAAGFSECIALCLAGCIPALAGKKEGDDQAGRHPMHEDAFLRIKKED
jgi:hypothetical protein